MTERRINYSHNVRDGYSIGWLVKGDKIYLAASVCNQLDQFSRKTARAVINARIGKKTRFSTSFEIPVKYRREVDSKAIRSAFWEITHSRPREAARIVEAYQASGVPILTAEESFKAIRKAMVNYFKIPTKDRKAESEAAIIATEKALQAIENKAWNKINLI